LLVAFVLVSPSLVRAQAIDPLGACMADNTTGRDRKDLAKWIFIAMAAHPDMKPLVTPGAAPAAEDISKSIGALVTRLLADACPKETTQALKTGGGAALEMAFGRLGQVAMQELMSDNDVKQVFTMFQKYVDEARLKKLAQ